MKAFIILIPQIISLSAFAASPTLTQLITNGSLPPQYRSTHTCSIQDRTVTVTVTGGVVGVGHTSKPTRFTSDIPNETVMNSLITEAATGQVKRHTGPVGAGVTAYTAELGKTKLELLSLTGDVTTIENTSLASKRLVKLLDKNCSN